jgi:hypothetical protein
LQHLRGPEPSGHGLLQMAGCYFESNPSRYFMYTATSKAHSVRQVPGLSPSVVWCAGKENWEAEQINFWRIRLIASNSLYFSGLSSVISRPLFFIFNYSSFIPTLTRNAL